MARNITNKEVIAMKRTTGICHSHTLLGELLVRRGDIGRETLEMALSLQQTTGQQLGEILISQGWLCKQGLARALRRQRNIRFAIGFVTAITLPAVAIADASLAQASSSVVPEETRHVGHMVPLPDAEMGHINARGSVTPGNIASWQEAANLKNKWSNIVLSDTASSTSALELLLDMAHMLLPFDAQISISDVVYAPDSVPMTVQQDGSIALRLPDSIGVIAFTDIRPRGFQGPSMGDLEIIGLQFNNTTLRISRH